MGYETKVYFVLGSTNTSKEQVIKDGDVWYHVYSEPNPANEGKRYFHFGKDGDTKTYVNNSKKVSTEDIIERSYCNLVAMVDLCKSGLRLNHLPKSDYYFYDSDGNNPVVEDRYGEFLRESSLTEFIDILESADSNYRRFSTALAVAKSMLGDYNDVKVLYYGH